MHRTSARGRAKRPAAEPCSTCTAQTSDGGTCDKPGLPDAPFPICSEHAIAIYRHLLPYLAEQSIDVRVPVNAIAHLSRKGRAKGADKSLPDVMNGWPSVVYYALIGEHVKIGTTTNLYRRLRWYPPSARLLAVEPGAQAVEHHRHEQFAHLRAARTEWFDPAPELMTHIDQLAAAGLPRAPHAPA